MKSYLNIDKRYSNSAELTYSAKYFYKSASVMLIDEIESQRERITAKRAVGDEFRC